MPTDDTILKTASVNDAAESSGGRRHFISAILIAAAVLYWAFQVAWFWRFCGHTIIADAISYIGIARHIRDGNFAASLHGYWSPLISWLLAGFMFGDRTQSAHILMLPLFVLCQILTYCLTQRLWGSRFLSSLAVLWFTAARGVAAFSVCNIGADFLLTATTLTYFILLLACLKKPEENRRWLSLGLVHAVAFLAKSIAMPLFALTTVLAVLSNRGRVRTYDAIRSLVVAAIFPALVWLGWSAALQQKYGVFTSGYQLRWNLLDPAAIQAANRDSQRSAGLFELTDTRRIYDVYTISDSMPPGSALWQVPVPGARGMLALLHTIVGKEIRNLPEAGKQLCVLLTPGGVLALILCVVRATRRRRQYVLQFRWMACVLCTVVALLLAYCMLVFDARYVLPIIPLLIALSVRFVSPAQTPAAPEAAIEIHPEIDSAIAEDSSRWPALAGVLLVLGLIFVQLYWASPFRTIDQDFQRSVYAAARMLKESGVESAVNIGAGPYPEHGVGWEAGMYAAYFSGSRLTGTLLELPVESADDFIIHDVSQLAPDAVMVWGSPADAKYASLVSKLQAAYPDRSAQWISDPGKGIVGTILIARELRHSASISH